MSVETIAAPPITTFPEAAVQALLEELLLDVVEGTAGLVGIALPAGKLARCAAVIQMISLDVVDVLCGVEGTVGFELKDSIVRPVATSPLTRPLGTSCRASRAHGSKNKQRDRSNGQSLRRARA